MHHFSMTLGGNPVNDSASLLGTSDATNELREEIEVAGASDARVLITGETGTGKDLVAQLVHAQSQRGRRGPLISLNCAGVPETLLESELFGHERGSFTGADRARVGLLGRADGGTLFLDEVGELSPRMQSLLLRFLDNGEIQRVGAPSTTRVDVRVIAATNLDLLANVAAGTFRLDLYYRLNVLRLRVAALRDRRDDIPVLLAHFLGLYAAHSSAFVPSVTPPALNRLIQHDWPGNVRELRNMAERLVAARHQEPVDLCGIARDLSSSTLLPDRPAADEPRSAMATVNDLYKRMTNNGESFWTVFHGPFMAHDLTRTDLRFVIALGLKATSGDYESVVRLFNMEASDHRRFRHFLRKHQCVVY
jgi:DNA-binding NtrC family response regulator